MNQKLFQLISAYGFLYIDDDDRGSRGGGFGRGGSRGGRGSGDGPSRGGFRGGRDDGNENSILNCVNIFV